MSNENKIRILYVQPGKYPEERFVANELPPFSGLSAGICKPYTLVKGQCGACLQRFGQGGRSAAEPLHWGLRCYRGQFLYLRFFRGGILQPDRQTVHKIIPVSLPQRQIFHRPCGNCRWKV